MRIIAALFSLLMAYSAAAAPALPVKIATAHGAVPLTLELAFTPAIREHGLMERVTLAPHDGMLFLFPYPAPISFWMKNTLIPLDMLFIASNGKIVRIAANTVPGDLTPIESSAPVNAVIELDGGAASRAGIAVGDKVEYSLPPDVHIE